MPAPEIRFYGGDERMDRYSIPVDSAQTIKPGWFVNEVAGECVPTDAATEDAVFAGVAITGHTPNKDYRSEISVAETCEVEVDVVSGTYTRGEGLKISGTDYGDDLTLAADAGANTIAWAAETKSSAVTRLRVRVEVWRLKKLRGSVDA